MIIQLNSVDDFKYVRVGTIIKHSPYAHEIIYIDHKNKVFKILDNKAFSYRFVSWIKLGWWYKHTPLTYRELFLRKLSKGNVS